MWTRRLAAREEDFQQGLGCVAKLCDGKTYLCRAPGTLAWLEPLPSLVVEEFQGTHPAGTVGLHIHTLCPAHRERTVWHIGYQDVAAVGRLFATGRLDVERVVALAGPAVKQPRLLRTRLGGFDR